jgi:hypothetical protein
MENNGRDMAVEKVTPPVLRYSARNFSSDLTMEDVKSY